MLKKAMLFAALVAALLSNTAGATCSTFCLGASGYSQSEWGTMVINYTITSNLPHAADAIVHLYINVDRGGCSGSNIVYEFYVDDLGKLYSLSTCNHITSPTTFQHNITYNKNGKSGAFIIPLGYLSDDGDAEVLVQATDDSDEAFDSTVISVEITGDDSP